MMGKRESSNPKYKRNVLVVVKTITHETTTSEYAIILPNLISEHIRDAAITTTTMYTMQMEISSQITMPVTVEVRLPTDILKISHRTTSTRPMYTPLLYPNKIKPNAAIFKISRPSLRRCNLYLRI